MPQKRFCLTCILAAVFVVALPANVFCAGDPWYNDVRNHWAEPYIRVLWEESVTDGYIPSVNPDVAKYWPEEFSTRAELATLLCKVFSLPSMYPEWPTYPDVPKSYRLFWNKPGWGFIEGAYYGGITFVPPGYYFKPDKYIGREDSVELLIRSLDLDEYAASLSAVEQDSILGRFWDHRYVSEDRRGSMACAIQMGIIKGYEDGSLRPSACLARGEAATVVARSCMIRMTARQSTFSPDGDGLDEVATFDLTYLKNRGIASWQAAIQDGLGATVCSLGPPGATGTPPASLTWAGNTQSGSAAPTGRYYYQALVTDNQGRQHLSVRKPLNLERHTLSTWLQPATCIDGRTLTVSAVTNPGARSVTATFADGIRRSLYAAQAKTYWELSLVMGPFLPAGAQSVQVAASFENTQRIASLWFTRAEDIWLDPAVSPNPAAWGQHLDLTCLAPASVTSAEATLFGMTVHLSRAGATWRGVAEVPWGISPGPYAVAFNVATASSTAEATVSLMVRGPDTSDLTFVLTK
ncbi:MAG: S-layer homology domain-containing protein [Bacillota bacterium]